MSTKIMAAILALLIAGIACLSHNSKVQAQEITIEPVSIPSADSVIKKVVDSTITIRDEFVAQKETLKDKVEILKEQQRQIKETQRQIDSSVLSQSYLPLIIIR